jgi:hypothetical protein
MGPAARVGNIFCAVASQKRLRPSDFQVPRGAWMLSYYRDVKICVRIGKVALAPKAFGDGIIASTRPHLAD